MLVCCDLFDLAIKAQINTQFPYFLSDPVVRTEGIVYDSPFHLKSSPAHLKWNWFTIEKL